MNPNDMPEVCECGHEESDHLEDEDSICLVPECLCEEWRPKDDQFYADREFDARAEKYDRSRE